MPETLEPPRRPRRPIAQRLLRGLWTTPFTAIPFALFFGTLYGNSWEGYVVAYKISLVFSFVIGYASIPIDGLADRWRPRLQSLFPAHPWLGTSLHYLVGYMLASYVAAFVINRWVEPRFLGDSRGWVVTGLFALMFVLMIGGILTARAYYQLAVERAASVERVRAELARAESRALRVQINPHFLFNTLNTIAALVAQDARAAEDVVTRLADVFRYALTSADHETSRFADELDFVRAYLEIEGVRLGDRLRVIERVEPGLDSVRIPSLILQPLVENAVRYAVSPRTEGGRVELGARRDGDRLVVTIADDGPGLSPGAAPQGHGVGLESVRERMRLSGPGYAFHLETEPGRGVRVRLEFPIDAPSPTTPSVAPEVCP